MTATVRKAATPDKQAARLRTALALPKKKAASAPKRQAAAAPAENELSPEMEAVFDLMLADIDQRLVEIGRNTDGLLASYNLA